MESLSDSPSETNFVQILYMPHSARHWPGGIPRCIKQHPTADLASDELQEEVKGWLLFVKENWVPRPKVDEDNNEYELRQRRALVEQWAAASQAFRDSFRVRAETENSLHYPGEALESIETTRQDFNPYALISLAPVQYSVHPENRLRFMKFAILLYRFDLETAHCLEDSQMPETVLLNPASQSINNFEDFVTWAYLETADFRSIYLTRSGAVVYDGFIGPFLLVDEEGLRTGRLSLVEFAKSGSIRDSMLVCPFIMFFPFLDLTVHMKELERNSTYGWRPQASECTPGLNDLRFNFNLEESKSKLKPTLHAAHSELSADVDSLASLDGSKRLGTPIYLALGESVTDNDPFSLGRFDEFLNPMYRDLDMNNTDFFMPDPFQQFTMDSTSAINPIRDIDSLLMPGVNSYDTAVSNIRSLNAPTSVSSLASVGQTPSTGPSSLTDSSCTCLTQALDLLNTLSSVQPSLVPEREGQDALSENKKYLERISSMLSCSSCTNDAFLRNRQ
ncbi:hypothetical protein BJX70DRAFT_401142 [Aspergillus crustosus]